VAEDRLTLSPACSEDLVDAIRPCAVSTGLVTTGVRRLLSLLLLIAFVTSGGMLPAQAASAHGAGPGTGHEHGHGHSHDESHAFAPAVATGFALQLLAFQSDQANPDVADKSADFGEQLAHHHVTAGYLPRQPFIITGGDRSAVRHVLPPDAEADSLSSPPLEEPPLA
jgi:hypothetical protein